MLGKVSLFDMSKTALAQPKHEHDVPGKFLYLAYKSYSCKLFEHASGMIYLASLLMEVHDILGYPFPGMSMIFLLSYLA
jgi:hypothetical protein